MKRLALFALCALLFAAGARADLIQQSTTYSRTVLVIASSDHVSGLAGATLTITASKAGGAFASITPTVTDLGSGWYKLALTGTHTNTVGALNLHITATSADATDTADQIVGFDPTSGSNLGLSALPTAAPAASGGLITVGTGSGQLSPNGQGNLTTPLQVHSGTATAGASTTITLQNTASATTDLYKGLFVLITSGTGVGQARVISGYNGGTMVATVSPAWITTPDATSVYTIIGNPHPIIDSNLAVTAGTVSDKTQYALSASQTFSTTGSVGSVTGSVGSVTGSVGSVTGNIGGISGTTLPAAIPTFPTNFSSASIDTSGRMLLQPSQTFTTTGAVGSVTGAVGSVTGAVGSVTGNVGGISGVTIPAIIPSLAQIVAALPSDASVATDVWGAGTRSLTDKSGFSLSQAFPTNFSSMLIDGTGKLVLQSAEHTNITNDVWEVAASSHNNGSTMGAKLNAAASAGDPWSVSLPGAYTTGTAGFILGTNLNAAITSRIASSSAPSNWSLFAIDTSGRVTLTPAEHALFPGDVLGATAASYNATNTIGAKINSAAAAGDPLSNAVPGAYASGTAGNVIGKLTFTGSNINSLVQGYASGQDPATLVLAATVDGSLTLKQIQALSVSIIGGNFTVVRNSSAKTLTVTYYRADHSTLLATMVTTYADTGLTQATGRVCTFSNLP